MSGMRVRQNQSGSMNVLLIPFIMTTVFLLAAIGFGTWAFLQRQHFKNDTDQIVESEVEVAVKEAQTAKDNEFVQKEKEPLKGYSSPAQYGSFSLKYPKTWSATVSEQSNSMSLIAHPDVVNTSNRDATYALKVEVLSSSYNQTVGQLDGQIKQGKITAESYSLPMVPDAVGLRVDGQVANGKNGAAVYLQLRDKTIKITCETEDRLGDFDDIILANFSFNP